MAKPRKPDELTQQLINSVWKCKDMIPRVKTFAWRLLRRALPSGSTAAARSKHISPLCSRCGLNEDDMHIIFLCPFARAAWFQHPWLLKVDILVQNCSSITTVVRNLLQNNHPHANLTTAFTFLWCLWKSRNDHRFGRKQSKPYQIAIAANALLQDQEVDQGSVSPHILAGHPSGTFEDNDFAFLAGPRFYVDATWKPVEPAGIATARLGVFATWPEQAGRTDIFVFAAALNVPSVPVAESLALRLAVDMAAQLNTSSAGFFTDNINVSSSVLAPSIAHPSVLWEIRPLVMQIKDLLHPLQASVRHISRNTNRIAHNCAHQALRSLNSHPILSCRNLAHSSISCPVLQAFSSINRQDIVILSVLCF